jgi:hypothetical protein
MKAVREDWRFFNEAAEARADWLKGLAVPPPPPPIPPAPPADWLRRGLGIGAAVLASGMAAALVLWILTPMPPTPVMATLGAIPPRVPPPVASIPPPQPPTPNAKVVVDYIRFTTVTIRDVDVITGWHYKSSEDAKPTDQFCYVRLPRSGAALTVLHVGIADSSIGVRPYDEREMAPLTLAVYDEARPNCRWYPGTVFPGVPSPGQKGPAT